MQKSMDYSTEIFSDFGSFLKVAVTQKIEVEISSNLLHTMYSTVQCILPLSLTLVSSSSGI